LEILPGRDESPRYVYVPWMVDLCLCTNNIFDFDDNFCSLGLGSGRADRYFNDKRTVL